MNIVQLKHIRMHDNARKVLSKYDYDALAEFLKQIEKRGAWFDFMNVIASENEGRELIANEVKKFFNNWMSREYITDHRNPILKLDFADITVREGRFPAVSSFIMGCSYPI